MNKRNLIPIVLFIAVASLTFSVLYSCKQAGKNIGLQLYSVRDSIVKDVPGTIAKVSKMGYTFVETGGLQ